MRTEEDRMCLVYRALGCTLNVCGDIHDIQWLRLDFLKANFVFVALFSTKLISIHINYQAYLYFDMS